MGSRFFRSGLAGLFLCFSMAVSAQTLPGIPPADQVQVKVDKLRLSGNKSLPTAEFEEILAEYEGRLLTMEDIRRVAEAVVARYRAHDYLTVSAYLPEQDLSSGELTIAVVEAKLGKVTVEGNKHYDTNYIDWMFQPALDDHHRTGELLRRSKVERQLLLINDTMDLNVRSILKEGAREGEVDLVLQVEDSRPTHLTLDYNNLGARSTGRHRLGAAFEWGNFTNRGDIFSLRYVESELLNADTEGLDLIYARYMSPLNNQGTYFDFSYANSAFQVGQELEILDIRGNADVFRAGVRHRLLRTSEANLDIEGAFVYQDVENTILGQTFSRDKLREVVLGVSGDWASGQGRNYAGLQLTQDLGELLGGTSSDDPLASRGAGGGFTKLNLDLSRVQRINDFSYFIVRGASQAAFEPLPYAEQFGLGGISTVRGYSQSSYLGDTGYNVSAEIRFAPIESNRQLFEVGAFIDHGAAAVKSPQPGEIPNLALTGAGVTFQFRLPEETFLRADLAWPLGNKDLLPNTEDGPVPYLLFSKRF